MGLLDFSGFVGDESIKDEFGMTQADRRQPLFTGLLKAGMLGMAAGENITPGQRAQLLGQVGGAITDIPEAMSRNRAEAAQMQLRRQQFSEGARKTADRERIQAYAQTPEFLEMIKGASGPNRLAIQAAVDSGDMAALNTAIGNLDKTEIGIARNEAAKARADAAQAERDRKNQGAWLGTNPDNQARNFLARGLSDPAWLATPEGAAAYAQAYHHMRKPGQPVRDADGNVTSREAMDMTGYPPPDPKFGEIGSPARADAEKLPAGGNKEYEDGTTITKDAASGKITITYDDGSVEVKEPGTPWRKTSPPVIPKIDETERREINKLQSEAGQATQEGNTLMDLFAKATPGERMAAALGSSTPLGQAWMRFVGLIKGDIFLKLGVPTGGDMAILQQVAADPGKWQNFFQSDANFTGAIKGVMNSVQNKVKYREDLVAPAKSGTYVGEKGEHKWSDIVETARNLGVHPNEVIRRYNLQRKGAK